MNTCSCRKGTLRPCLLRASSARHCSTTPEYAVGLSSGLPGQAKGMSAAGQQKRKRATSPPSGESSSTENDSGRAQGAGCRRSCRERNGVERYVPTGVLGKRVSQDRLPTRFHITPMNEWEWLLRKVNLCVRNRLEWRNGTPLPTAPPIPAGCCRARTTRRWRSPSIRMHCALGEGVDVPARVVSRIGQSEPSRICQVAQPAGTSAAALQQPYRPRIHHAEAAVGEHGKDVHRHSAAECENSPSAAFRAQSRATPMAASGDRCALPRPQRLRASTRFVE